MENIDSLVGNIDSLEENIDSLVGNTDSLVGNIHSLVVGTSSGRICHGGKQPTFSLRLFLLVVAALECGPALGQPAQPRPQAALSEQ